MPGKNGTGPFGEGPMTGRGYGFCTGNGLRTKLRRGLGYGCRRGFGNGYYRQSNSAISSNTSQHSLENLIEQKRLLEKRIQEINNSLEKFEKSDTTNSDR